MKLRICLFTLGAKAQKSQKKLTARYSPRSNALAWSCKSCAAKHFRAPEPAGILNVLLTPCEGDTSLHTCQGILPDTDCIITHDAFQNESGCDGLGDSITAVKQLQYSDVDIWQLLLSELMPYLHWCPYDRLGMDAVPRNRAQYGRTRSPTTLRRYVY